MRNDSKQVTAQQPKYVEVRSVDPWAPAIDLQFELKQLPVVVGSASDARVRIHDRGVGLAHCEILHRNGALYVRDLESGFGTKVNEQAIESEQPIGATDLLMLGIRSLCVSLVTLPLDAGQRRGPFSAKVEPQGGE